MTSFQLPHIATLTPKLARQILSKLKEGTSPPGAVEYLWVDRGGWAGRMGGQLDRASDDELTELRIAAGYYGTGKTHALASVATLALDRNWAVARMKFADTDAFDPVEVFQQVTTNLTTVDRVRANSPDAANAYLGVINDGFDWVLRRKADELTRKHATEPLPTQAADAELTAMLEQLSLPISVERAVAGYFRAHWDKAVELRDSIKGWWLKGEAVRRPVLLEKHTDGHLLMVSLVRILRAFGYRGLLITVDEFDAALKLTPRKRSAAWENLRAQIDHAGAPGMLVIVAMAASCLNDPKGPEENEALKSRIRVAKKSAFDSEKKFDPNSTILALDKLEFSRDDLLSIGKQLRELFEVGEGKEGTHLDDEEIGQIVDEVIEVSGQRKAARCRVLVQVVVNTLNERKDEPDSSLDQLRQTIREQVLRTPANA